MRNNHIIYLFHVVFLLSSGVHAFVVMIQPQRHITTTTTTTTTTLHSSTSFDSSHPTASVLRGESQTTTMDTTTVPNRFRRFGRRVFRRRPTNVMITETSDTSSQQQQQQQQQQQHFLSFSGQHTVTTEPFVVVHSDTLMDFFRTHRHLLFPNQESTVIDDNDEEVNSSFTKWIETWTERATAAGGVPPVVYDDDTNHKLLSNTDQLSHTLLRIRAPLQMPGLQVVSESIVGCRLSSSSNNDNDNNTTPEFQFTVLDSSLTAHGPAKWLFEKLSQYLVGTSSFTRVSAIRDNHHHNNDSSSYYYLITDAQLETSLQLPPAVARWLPNNFEQQGSRAIQRLLTTELGPALQGFRQALVRQQQQEEAS